MSVKKTAAWLLSLCMLLSVFIVVPSIEAQALSTDIAVITSDTAALRTNADPYSAQVASVSKNSTFLLLDSETGSDGHTWYKLCYSPTLQGWISSANAVTRAASSTHADPYTIYLKQLVSVAAESYILRASAGDSSAEVVTVHKGDRMVVLDHGSDSGDITWYEVCYGSTQGWIKRTAVSISNICSSPASYSYQNGSTPVIYLSPSRQPANPYAFGGTNECEQMTRVSAALKDILEQTYDCKVYMADFEPTIDKYSRPLQARQLGADIYLAIHSNAGSGTRYGAQGYYYPGSAQSMEMAQNLVDALSAVSPFSGNAKGIHNGMNLLSGVGYGEVRDPGGYGMISLLLEVEFHDNADSARWIIDNTVTIARAIADGLDETFDFKPRNSTTSTTAATVTTGIPTLSGEIIYSTAAGTTTTATATAPSASVSSTAATSVSTTTTTTTVTTSSTTSTASSGITLAPVSTTTTLNTTTVPTASAAPPSSSRVIRAGGSSRIETAVEISSLGWDKASTVIIASGSGYADALAGVPLSAAADAPILLTCGTDSAEPSLLAEVTRLGAEKAYILGGTSAVSEGVERSLTSMGIDCERLSGSSRYETCAAVAWELVELTGGVFDTLYFASGENFPDALAIGAVAAIDGCPILYVGSQSELTAVISDFARQTGCRAAVLTGGRSAVSDTGLRSIEKLGISVERISGADRYSTALAVVNRFSSMFDGSGAALATGKSFPDALAGGAHAAKLHIPVLLTGDSVSSGLLECAAQYDGDVYVYGGTGAVSEAAAQAVSAVLG